MNQDVKKLWVEALRSGDYKQGHGRLKEVGDDDDEHRYCCLGVLCDLAIRAGVEGAWGLILTSTYVAHYYTSSGPDDGDLPTPVMRWAELDKPNPMIDPVNGRSAITCNDDFDMSFDEIADLIEENL